MMVGWIGGSIFALEVDYAEEYLRNGGTEESLGIISPYDSQALGESRRVGRFLKVVRIRWNQKSMNVFVWEIRKSG